MDTREAERAGGVRLVLTPFNAPKLVGPPMENGKPTERVLQLLQDDKVLYNRQPIAVVVAETLEQAEHAAALVRVRYADVAKPVTDLHKGAQYTPEKIQDEDAKTVRGDLSAGKRAAYKTIEATYTTPFIFHSPMETHATTAIWEGPDKLTVYDATQGIFRVRRVLSRTFGLPVQNVRCINQFLGGGFGGKGAPWSHVPLAALAAKLTGRPVKLVLERPQTFGMVGYRPETEQKMLSAASEDGKLTAMRHDLLHNTSTFDEYIERAILMTRMLYACPNQETSARLSRVDMGTPTFTRGPGETSGSWALESIIDETAYAVGMDPLAFRLQNYTEIDPGKNKPFSSKSLRECYRIGAERFGWEKRTPAPRSMRSPDGRLLGMGMATATYPTKRGAASALARLMPDGTALVQAGTQELGTGTYTVMTQIAADALGLPVESVRFELGDTLMPENPQSSGSQTAASTGSAVRDTCVALKRAAIQVAINHPASPLHGLTENDIAAQNGRLQSKSDATRGETYEAVVKRNGGPLEVRQQSKPGEEHDKYSMHSFGAVFAEVLVDPLLGETRVSRITGVYGVGKVLNAKTCRSQILGGMVFGVGMALMEDGQMDRRTGRLINANLAEYHVPTNADIPTPDIHFVDEYDPHINPIGAKGAGEIGTTGIVAAIGNAIFHATGVRVRDLPITPDKLLRPA